jgi:NAD(P)H-hydrate epimerase
MITSQEMKKLENLSEKQGISKLKLMENAGYGFFKEIEKKVDLEKKKILVLCGSGNNGGDGFVIARYLNENEYDVKVLFIGKKEKLKKESEYNYFRLKESCNDVFHKGKNYKNIISSADVIIDAMLGTGIKGKLREPYSSIVDLINNSNTKVIAVDIPTGLDPNTGKVLDKSIDVNLIITFHDIKTGLMKFKDKVVVVDIGIPDESIKKLE